MAVALASFRRLAFVPAAKSAILVAICLTARAVLALPPEAAAASGAGGGAAVDPKVAFDEAVNSFKYQDFDNAIPQLRGLLYPTPRVDRRREWQVREYLGASLWWSGSRNEANDEFTALLVRDAAHKLDPAVYPPKMISEFEALRTNLIRLGIIKADAPEQNPLEMTTEAAPLGLMFVPLGVGQFANHSPGKGAAFMATEVVLAGLSGAFYLINQRDGLKGPGHMTTVNQAVQLSAGGAFFAVAIAGIVEAVVSWNPAARSTP